MEVIAPPRSGLRMRTLRGGARNYVEKTIKTREGSDPTLSNSTYFQGARLTTRVSSVRHALSFLASSIPQILPVSGPSFLPVREDEALSLLGASEKMKRCLCLERTHVAFARDGALPRQG